MAYDHKFQAVVVAIRGSLSLHVSFDDAQYILYHKVDDCYTLQDFITDLSSEPQVFSTCEDGDIYGHRVCFHLYNIRYMKVSVLFMLLQGMLISAHAVQLQLENKGLIEKAFKAFPVSVFFYKIDRSTTSADGLSTHTSRATV